MMEAMKRAKASSLSTSAANANANANATAPTWRERIGTAIFTDEICSRHFTCTPARLRYHAKFSRDELDKIKAKAKMVAGSKEEKGEEEEEKGEYTPLEDISGARAEAFAVPDSLIDLPPENVRRLRVLLDRDSGTLRQAEFAIGVR